MKVRDERLRKAKKYQKELRENATKCESMFYPYLKNIKFEFQKIFFINDYEFFIVDFYIPKFKLVIEIDGPSHDTKKEYDRLRTKKLKEVGVRKVLRFTNTDILTLSSQRIKELLIVNLLA